MSRIILHVTFLLVLIFLTQRSAAQTTLYTGDVAVVGFATDLSGCGFPAESDEISLAFFTEIATGTTFHITDNGWETSHVGYWGDGEGTLSLTRTGMPLPAGSVITIRGINNAGIWTYSVLGFAGQWAIGEINTPGGGPFNLEFGGDQIYIMQGGTWDNQGAGGDDALYDGNILFGFNTRTVWSADGSNNQSNLYDGLDPCGHMEAPNAEFYKYTDPLTSAFQVEWMRRVISQANFSNFGTCVDYDSALPNYEIGYVLQVASSYFGLRCPSFCDKCSPATFPLVFDLPVGYAFDIVYTNGIDTFSRSGLVNWDFTYVTLTDTATFWIISAAETGGCPLPPRFQGEANYFVPYRYPGEHAAIYVCPDFQGGLPLNHWLQAEAGGIWSPPLVFNTNWINDFGEGTFIYTHFYENNCPRDTGSVKVIFMTAEGTTIEVVCDQNGTPNYIFDDLLILTVTVNGNNFGTEFAATISSGTITPSGGLVGVPTVFTLSPGSALLDDLILYIENLEPPEEHINIGTCLFEFPIESPGFCSDPCDYSMEASITGDAEICVNVCPDNPVYAEIEVSGGTPPYVMDFSVSATGFPTWTFTEIPVLEFNEIIICIDNVPAPVFNPINYHLTIPANLAGSFVNIDLINVYDYYNCTAILDGAASVEVHPLPELDTFAFTVCSEFSNNVDLTEFDDEINLFYDVIWYDGNPFTIGDLLPNPNSVNLNNVVQLWAEVTDDYCTNAIQVQFTILPSPRLSPIPPIEICVGSSVTLGSIPITDLGNSMALYTFHTGLPLDSSTMILTPTFTPVDTVTIYLLATAMTCYDTVPIAINVSPYPDFTLEGTPCNLALNTYSVLFTSSADSIHVSAGTVTNNPTGQDMVTGIPDGINITIEVISASGLCKDTFSIIAPNCDCPAINPPVPAQPTYEICDDEAIPVFSVTIDPGLSANWYDVPSGGVAILQNSLTYQPATLTSATYYAEALNVTDGCPSLRTPIPFTVNPSAILQGVADPVLCAPGTINIDALVPGVLNGVSGSGSWFNLANNQPVSGTIQPASGDSWYYVFSSNPGMCISTDTISAVVNPLPVMDVYEIICDENTLTYSISFESDAELVQANIGNLTNVPGTDTFTITGVAFATDIQLNLENTSTGCSTSILQTAPDCTCPALLQQDDDVLCSDAANIDLSVYEGFGVSGTWQLVSTPPGGSPATLTGSNFQGQNGDPGLYVLRFIRSMIITDCVDSALFELTLRTSPFAHAGTDGTVCAPDVITLSGMAGGTNVQYSWQTTGAGSVQNANALNTTYTPLLADFTSGSVSFTLTATDQTGSCPAAQETIIIDIDATAYFILDSGTLTYCDTSDIMVELDAFIDYGTTGGTWFFPSGVTAPITNNSQFNPSDLVAGNYTVYYTTSNAVLPCENDTAGINLIIENCLCPSVALSTPTDALCTSSGTVNLNTFLITTEAGTWSISGTPAGANPAVLNGSNFVTNQSDDGIYTLRFTLSQPVTGCDAFAEVTLEVIQTPTLQLEDVECSVDLLSWEATLVTTAEVVSNSDGLLTALGNNRYRITNLLAGNGTQVTASNGSGLCSAALNISAPDCDCEIAIGTLPANVSLCPGESMTYTASVTGGKGQITSFWIVANDSLYQSTIEVDQTGPYTFVSIDSLGCRDEHTINSTIYMEMVADIDLTAITCPGDNDGSIIIFEILQGNGPFSISLNNGAFQPITTFPFQLSNLGQGNYTIEIVDAFNCKITSNVNIPSSSVETLSLGPDATILVGDSVLIQAILSFTPDSFAWSIDIDEINPDQLSSWASPLEDMNLTLVAYDSKGCLYTDAIQVRVLLTSSVIVPNIFSPNGDGINDLIAPSTDPSIVSIEYFEIFSRWGELVYSKTNFLPNQNGDGWDGTLYGKEMNPGVFLYRVSATNKKGQEVTEYGDLTLVR